MFKRLIKKIREVLGIEKELKAINRDIIALMDKDLAFQEQYPLDDKKMVRPTKPNMSAELAKRYEYCEGEEQDTAWGAFYCVWSTGFAGPFDTHGEALFYADQTGITKSKFFDIKKLYRYLVAEKK